MNTNVSDRLPILEKVDASVGPLVSLRVCDGLCVCIVTVCQSRGTDHLRYRFGLFMINLCLCCNVGFHFHKGERETQIRPRKNIKHVSNPLLLPPFFKIFLFIL